MCCNLAHFARLVRERERQYDKYVLSRQRKVNLLVVHQWQLFRLMTVPEVMMCASVRVLECVKWICQSYRKNCMKLEIFYVNEVRLLGYDQRELLTLHAAPDTISHDLLRSHNGKYQPAVAWRQMSVRGLLIISAVARSKCREARRMAMQPRPFAEQ